MKKKLVKKNRGEFINIFTTATVGFFSLAWIGIILSTVSYLAINKIFESFNLKKNNSSLKWFIWFLLGFSINIIHLRNYPRNLLFYNESGVGSQNSINSALEKIAKQCELQGFSSSSFYFDIPKLVGYKIIPSNGSCLGDKDGKIKAVRSKKTFIFSWWTITSYNPLLPKSLPKEIIFDIKTGIKSCVPSEEDHFCVIGR